MQRRNVCNFDYKKINKYIYIYIYIFIYFFIIKIAYISPLHVSPALLFCTYESAPQMAFAVSFSGPSPLLTQPTAHASVCASML